MSENTDGHQLDFFNVFYDEGLYAKTGSVYQQSDGTWKAMIENGWWVAIRETKEAAIKAVKKIRDDEFNLKQQVNNLPWPW